MSGVILVGDGGMDPAVDPEEEVLERVDHDNTDSDSRQRQVIQQDNVAANLQWPLGINGPGRMELTDNELNLAINIKEAIASTPEVDPVSDFMCAQLALIDGDDTEGAVERAHQLQCFREEYGILDTVEDGKRCFSNFIGLFPEFFLCFTYIPEAGTYVMVFDANKFRRSKLNSDERLRAFMGVSYYTLMTACPDFEAIMSGCVLLMECEGYDWKRDMDFKIQRKVWSEIAKVYPMSFEKIRYFNASNTMIIVQSMLKQFLPNYLRRKFELGWRYEERLDSLYMVPTVEAAKMRLLARLEVTLDRRYENERTFRL